MSALRTCGTIAAACLSAPLALAQVPADRDATRTGFVGDVSCSSCHQEQARTYRLTAHAKTSAGGSRDSIHGNFETGANRLRTSNPDLYFQMEARPGGFFQTAVVRTSPIDVLTRTERIDIAVGSGRKGQTYLYWDGDELFQLPVSYWAEGNAWINSPGYVDGTANFERPIPRRCLECHATSFESRAPPEHRYAKPSLVLGLSCEKCHGPGAEHAARFRSASPPTAAGDTAIVNPARLARERQIDVCSLCHAGLGQAVTAPLSFRPGEVLAEHLAFPPQAPSEHIDVHASQVQLLEQSRCFQSSPAMTCSSCHNVHRPERDLAALAARCTSCHQLESCGLFPARGHAIAERCVECHMPLERTEQIVIAGAIGAKMQPQVRNHRIAIYPAMDFPRGLDPPK